MDLVLTASRFPVVTRDPLAMLADPGLRLLTGPRSLLAAGFAWLVARVAPPSPLVVVDGAGCVDAACLTEVAGFTGEAPRDLAARVHVAYAATPYQVAAFLEAASADAVQEAGRHTLLLGPLDLLGRDDLMWAEEGDLLDRIVRALATLGAPPRSALVVCPDLPAVAARGPRAAFVPRIAAMADLHLRFDDDRPVTAEMRKVG
ncbi:MAG TPA: hypothetical protein VF406_05955 [Thermodesulfobacteriota bacterium]